MLGQLSWWPWILGLVASFFISLYVIKGKTFFDNPLIPVAGGSGAVAALIGLMEASSTGLLLGESVSSVIDFMFRLAITSLPGAFVGLMGAAWVHVRGQQKSDE